MSVHRRHNLEQAPRVGLQEAKEEFDRGATLFVDVRRSDEYDRCHIPGAVSVPLAELRARADELTGAPSIITY